MMETEFLYNGERTIIQCNAEDTMENIINKFISKRELKEEIHFIYGGSLVDKNLTFFEQSNSEDKKRNKITIIGYDKKDMDNSEKELIESKIIICPNCFEDIRINIKDFKIKLFDCKNGDEIDNILFSEFKKTQNIDESKIMCEICKNTNKSETYEHNFFRCIECNKNLCPLCKLNHTNHTIINYSQKNLICNQHNEPYTQYCKQCKKNICLLCEKEHVSHGLISYGLIMPNQKEMESNRNKLRGKINEIRKDINKIMKKLNSVIENIESYYCIYNNIVDSFEIKTRNYQILQNIQDMSNYNNIFIDELDKLLKEKDIHNKFKIILELNDKMTKKEILPIDLKSTEEKSDNISSENKVDKPLNQEKKSKDKRKTVSDKKKLKNKYDNFNIDKLKSLMEFNSKNSIEKLIVLSDERIISLISNNISAISIYSLRDNNYICDLYLEMKVKDIIELDDGNLLISTISNNYEPSLNIVKIKDKELETIKELKLKKKDLVCPSLYKLSNGRAIAYDDNGNLANFYTYGKEKLTPSSYNINTNNEYITSICEINKNEIAISQISKTLSGFSNNYYIRFYEVRKKQINKSICAGGKLCLINEKYLIAVNNEQNLISLIDLKANTIINKISFDFKNKIKDVVALNEKRFLINTSYLYYFEIENNNEIKLKGNNNKKFYDLEYIGKYPGNKIITGRFSTINIYGYNN